MKRLERRLSKDEPRDDRNVNVNANVNANVNVNARGKEEEEEEGGRRLMFEQVVKSV